MSAQPKKVQSFDPRRWLDGDVEAEWVVPRRRKTDFEQPEIEGMLGVEAPVRKQDRAGIHAIANSGLVSSERLPMLDVIFDRLVRVMSTSLRNFTSDNIEVAIEAVASVRFGDYLNSVPLPAMLGVFRAREWDNFGLLTIESNLIYAVVDTLLGGRRATAPMRVEGRPYTTIETTLVERLIAVVLKDLSAAFEPLSPVTFVSERIETNPRFAGIARPTNAAVLVRFRLEMEDRGGRMELLFPYATLEPIRELLLQRFMGEKFGRDSIWETHLASELWRTHLSLAAILDERTMTLGEVAKFEVGQTLVFNTTPDSPVELRCGDVALLEGRLGRSGANIGVQVTGGAAIKEPAE